MSDLITQLCQLTAEILQDNPHADVARLVGLVKQGIDANLQLGQAIQSDRQLIQINEGNAKGFQTLVTGGIANIGIHLNDVNRETLQEVLQEALGELLKSLQKRIPSNVRQGSKNFVGREDELAEIHAKLQEGQGVIVCAVEGMGGVGKTELALQYATRYQHEYVARYWLSLREMGLAQAVVTMASPYLDLPEAMNSASEDELAAWCWQNWLPETGKLLVILDDVPKAESIPDLAMPIDPRVRVLVTTRERELNVGFESVPLDVLSEEKALELLRKIVGAAKVDKELVTVKEICITLGYLPLGIELTGEYLSKNRFLTFAKLQERLNLVDESIARERTYRFYAHRGVEAAIQLSWDDISTDSQRVAMLLGLFAPVEILWELVAGIGASAEITEAELNEARGQLDSLHLIKPVGEECNFYKIHTLVREFFRAKLLKAEENHQFRQAFVTRLLDVAKEIPAIPTRDLIARVAPAIPHLDIVSREMLDDITNPEEDLGWAFTGIARFYEGQGLYGLAEDPLQRRLIAVKELLGDCHPKVATSLNNLALLYSSQGRYAEAEPLYQKSLEIDKSIYGESHTQIATGLNNLAHLYDSQGRYAEAEPLYQESLQLWREILGDQHPSVALSLNNLATLYDSQGRYTEAEPLYQESLRLWRGDRHPHVATSLNNLAHLYDSQGRYAEAEPLYQESLQLWREILGDRHPHVATSLNNLAHLYNLQGRYAEAESLYQDALRLRREILGDRHPDIATSLNNLAELYSSQGRYAEAELLFQESLKIVKIIYGESHAEIASVLNNIALMYSSQRRYAEAEPLFQESLQLKREQLGDRHPSVALTLNCIAILYHSQRRYAEAEPLFQESLQLTRELLGDRHPYVANCLNNLAALRYKQNRYDDANALFLQALEIRESVLGSNHPDTQSVKESLAYLRTNQGKS
ncbi:MAG: tetratricopeptide repeat protein [Pseudanabaena sp. M085S1SP2A07QC]|nr:tetratricopeptide repeat protein [Pseudanabaena sp. M037S2SP2A07QC]MCA6544141.1 tetratricopeptide repeat protein [Pseudanabaena sp. M074S1SP2A07QC]MCA6546541.1 tetratricopeptide repeat protein [Pseudanabaena sp. M152S2SP2A07QC]MCA6563401.1 tetratricopeptide repeat protein [Pseudanabaena sp. M151S2SP2A07QC]MCA6578519.1 tetratricopeptide repeat protein [Pseudanabaena sp. M085S1SP2A07QC]